MTNRFNLLLSLIFFVGIFAGNTLIAQDKPNVLFIAIDDLRPTIGAYDDPIAKTPNIDQLAEQSVLFKMHYAQQAVCSPSRTSMLTGLRPDEVKVINQNADFRDTRPDAVTLPQIFKKQGYETVGIGKVFHYRPGFQDPESWSVELYSTNHGLKKTQYVLPENRTGGKAAASEKADVRDDAYLEGKYTSLAVDFLRKYERTGESFFLTVGYLKPHLPFSAPARYWDMYDRDEFEPIEHPERPEGAPDLAFHDNNETRGYSDVPDRGDGPIPLEKKKELRHGYYATVSYIDAQVGKLLETLDELGLRENTIVVLWGDHGFHLGEQTIWAKSNNYELSARAPLIISAPGVSKAGEKSNAIVESLDIYPTLIDLAGIEPDGKLSGKSLKPLLINPNTEWDNVAFNQFPRPYRAGVSGNVPMSHMGYSVRTENWRYIVWYNVKEKIFELPELYNLEVSQIETKNLAHKEEYSEVKKEHHEMVKKYVEKYND